MEAKRTETATSSAQPNGDAPSSDPPARARESRFGRLGGLIRTMRPHQWVKNVFVLAPAVFAKELFEPRLMLRSLTAFAVFCLLASSIYTINDIADIGSDREHPIKRHRPIASGRVPLGLARGLAVVLLVTSLVGAAATSAPFLVAAVCYLTLNLAYSSRLKHIAYVDVACIAGGFVLRVVAGGVAARVEVSHFILTCTALLALFLGLGKRRHELAAGLSQARSQRRVMASYSLAGLDRALVVTAALTFVTYVAYTLDAHTRAFFRNDWLWVSALFVGFGVARFLHLVRSEPEAESPTQEMLKDFPFISAMLAWVALVMWVAYRIPTP